jgi:MFS family permease
MAGTGWLLALLAGSGAAVGAGSLIPAMVVVGLGMGATLSALFDVAIGDIDPGEAGSASGSFSSIQQLANAAGPAIITTVYFHALRRGPSHAMTTSLATVLGVTALSCLAVRLLPQSTQPDNQN